MQIQRKLLEGALNTLMKAISSRPGIPALHGVLIRKTAPNGSGYGTLRMTATDLDWSITTDMLTRSDESFDMLVPARTMLDVVKAWDGSMFDIIPFENPGKNGKPGHVEQAKLEYATLRTLPVEDFPAIKPFDPDVVPTFVAPAKLLGEALKITLKSISGDSARPILTGILLEGAKDAPLTLTSTDSYRLNTVEIPEAIVDAPFKALISTSKAVPALASMLVKAGPGDMVSGYHNPAGTTDSFGFVTPDGTEWGGRCIVGEFPNWRQLVPDARDLTDYTTITFDTADMLRCIRQVALFARESSPVKLTTVSNGQVMLAARSPDLGEAERWPASASWTGKELTAGFNPTYLSQAIEAIDGDSLVLRDALKPGFVAKDNARALVMPVRLPAHVG